jgi:hypothetical protein
VTTRTRTEELLAEAKGTIDETQAREKKLQHVIEQLNDERR